jgi:hypothetical protein
MTPETNAHAAIRLRIHQFILNSPKPCQRTVTRSRLQPSAKHGRYRDRGRKSTRSQFAQFISFPSSAFLSLSDRAERNSAGNAPCLCGGPRWSAFRRLLTIAFRAALSFDVRYLIWEVVPSRLAAGSAALERRPAVPRSGDIVSRTRSPTAAPPVDNAALDAARDPRSLARSHYVQNGLETGSLMSIMYLKNARPDGVRM